VPASAAGARTGACALSCRRFGQNLGGEEIAAAGNHLDELPLIVAKGGPDLPDALKQAVVADMDVRPDRVHQLLLAQDPPAIGGQQGQHGQRLRSKLDGSAV
jgi:hypothetical protein